MKVIIPMAGTGQRFVAQNYEDPKPLIPVCDKRIIEYILDMFDEKDDITFICNETHINETDMALVLKALRPISAMGIIPNHKRGPIFTIKPHY